MADLFDFPTRKIREGSAEFLIPKGDKVSKDLPVFYNPVMKRNRDVTVLVLRQFPGMRVCDPLAGSGIRSIRIAKETEMESITANDYDDDSVLLMHYNMRLNEVSFGVCQKDATLLLLASKGFDFIDIDPFGSPNPFLDAAVKRVSRGGILGVTATDTSGLCGTHKSVCERKYWATPLHGPEMKEVALRILIRKIQLVGAQYERALFPIFSYVHEHYFRIFVQCFKSKEKVKQVIRRHGAYKGAGPMWLGNMWDSALCGNMVKDVKRNKLYNADTELVRFLETVHLESDVAVVGINDIHFLCKKHKIGDIPRKDVLMKRIKKRGFDVSETHINGYSLRTTADEETVVSCIKKK